MFYYRLKEWSQTRGYLFDTCLTAQDNYRHYLITSKSSIEMDVMHRPLLQQKE